MITNWMTRLARRHKRLLLVGLSLSTLTAIASSTPAPGVPAVAVESKLDQSQAGYYRMKVGDVAVTALSDGTFGLDVLGVLSSSK